LFADFYFPLLPNFSPASKQSILLVNFNFSQLADTGRKCNSANRDPEEEYERMESSMLTASRLARSDKLPVDQNFIIGIVGLGDMGKMYARRLSDAGWR
jgi:hypothetical protein